MRFLHKWQGKISQIVIDEDSPANTPNDSHQLKIVSLQNNPVFRNILCTFFGLRKKSQEISHATIAIHCLKGSALGERTDWIMRNICSWSATSDIRILPSAARNLNW